MSVRPIFLDYNATTPVDAKVLGAMLPWFSEEFGNSSSKRHSYGWAADEAVEKAREQVAALVSARPEDVTFTSGATEALNLAIRGVAPASIRRGKHLVTVATEHSAVLEPHSTLERAGFEVTTLGVDSDGRLDLDVLRSAIRPDTVLVTVMLANNETGVIHPLEEIHGITRKQGVPLLSDATQAIGKIPTDVRHCDLLAFSAHKFYGPKGAGALVRNPNLRRLRLLPLIEGGGQERGLRGGTVNVPAVVGMGAAAELASEVCEQEAARQAELRDRLETILRESLGDDLQVFGGGSPRLPNTSNFSIVGAPADRIIAECRDLALSTGSACGSGTGRTSHVITAMLDPGSEVPMTVRMSLGRQTTPDQVETAAEMIARAASRLRSRKSALA
jgi:cysteine desulfurase